MGKFYNGNMEAAFDFSGESLMRWLFHINMHNKEWTLIQGVPKTQPLLILYLILNLTPVLLGGSSTGSDVIANM